MQRHWIQQHRKALADHVDDEDKLDGVTIRDSIGRKQTPVFINESGLYALIFEANLICKEIQTLGKHQEVLQQSVRLVATR